MARRLRTRCGRDPDGRLVYRFDHLLPGHFYHLDTTLRECDGAGRQESILIDGNLIDGPVDLADGQPHYLSRAPGSGALCRPHDLRDGRGARQQTALCVSQINLHDIDYRYADAGGGNDPQYPGTKGYGWLDGVPNLAWGALPYQSVRVDQSDNRQRYQFDGLNPSRQYQVNLTYYQGSGTGRQQMVEIDGLPSGLQVDTGDYTVHRLTATAPLAAYVSDGSIVVSTVRTNASTGALVNEVSLEELTQLTGPRPTIANLRITNVSDTSFTVSWTTNVATTGYVHYGASEALGQLAYDERGSAVIDDTHHVKLENLAPGTTYYLDVLAGQAIDNNGGSHYSVATGITLPPPASDTIYGRVFKLDGTTLAGGAMVYARVCDANGQGSSGCSAWLSSLVGPDNGYWYANLGQALSETLGSHFSYSPSGDRLELAVEGAADCHATLSVDTAEDSPVADIVLRCTIQATMTSAPGWNLIALPIQTVAPLTAQSLLDLINSQGGQCSEIDRWRFGGWDAHINGLPFNDYSIDLGSGYFAKCSANASWILERQRAHDRHTDRPASRLEPGERAHPPWVLHRPDTAERYSRPGRRVQRDRPLALRRLGRAHQRIALQRLRHRTGAGLLRQVQSGEHLSPPAGRSEDSGKRRLAGASRACRWSRSAKAAIGEVLVTNRRDVALTVTWRTDQPSDGWVEYGLTPELGQVATTIAARRRSSAVHQATLTGLLPKRPSTSGFIPGTPLPTTRASPSRWLRWPASSPPRRLRPMDK